MKTKNAKTIINTLTAIALIAVYTWASNDDYKEQIKSQDNADYVRELSRQEAEEKKREFNVLAFEAQRLTTYAGDLK